MSSSRHQIAFIDHYDSFSRNVIDWLAAASADVDILQVYSDDASGLTQLRKTQIPLVFSPGPKAPSDNLLTLDLLRATFGHRPILGICLGHQMLAQLFRSPVTPCLFPRHGATRQIHITDHSDLFRDMPQTFAAAAYNSLGVTDAILQNPNVDLLAKCEKGEIQSLRFRPSFPGCPAYGLQFHPESFLSEQGPTLAANALRLLTTPR